MRREFEDGSVVYFAEEHAPLIVNGFIGRPTLESARFVQDTSEKIFVEYGERYGACYNVVDGRRAERPDALVRRFWAESAQKPSAGATKYLRGTLVVIDNAILRGVLTAVGWVSPQAREFEVMATIDEAIDEARKRLEAAGCSLPPRVPFIEPDDPHRAMG